MRSTGCPPRHTGPCADRLLAVHAVVLCREAVVEDERVPGEPSARPERRGDARERAAAVRPGGQVQERAEGAVDQRRRLLQIELAHVALTQVELDPRRGGVGAGLGEHRRRGVDSDHGPPGRLRDRDRHPPVADRKLDRDEALVITAITHAVLTRDVQVNLQPSLSDGCCRGGWMVVSCGRPNVCRPTETHMTLARRLALLTAVLVAAGTAVSAGSAAADAPVQGATTCALGDSLAFGYQPNLVAAGDFDPADYRSYAEEFADMRTGLTLVNYGCPSETSSTLIDGGCPWPFPLHDSLGGATSQLRAARRSSPPTQGRSR